MVILFDIFNLSDNIFEIVFATKQQKIVGELLFNMMLEKGGEITKSEMSEFATRLHDGRMLAKINEPEYKGKTVKLSYNKRQFYDRILTPMKSMGLIYYDLYKKTYKISERFNRELQKVGQMWLEQLNKKAKKK